MENISRVIYILPSNHYYGNFKNNKIFTTKTTTRRKQQQKYVANKQQEKLIKPMKFITAGDLVVNLVTY